MEDQNERERRVHRAADNGISLSMSGDDAASATTTASAQELCAGTEMSDDSTVSCQTASQLTTSSPHELASSPAANVITAPTVSVVTGVASTSTCPNEVLPDTVRTVPSVMPQPPLSTTNTLTATGLDSFTMSGNGPVSVCDYCQAFEQWSWQYYWWSMHVQWMTWAASQYMSMPMYTPPASSIASTVGSQPAAPPVTRAQHQQYQQQPIRQPAPQPARGCECRIPSLSRRVTAEFIDFLLVFSIKLAVSIIAVEYGFDLFQSVPATDVETLLTMNWDPNLALSITSELVMMEVINRIFICIFESLCLSLVGATPGKRMLGIRVIACTELTDLPGNRVRVLPAGNIDLTNAVVRSVIKNFSLAFFFPVCLTVFFFTHNRTGYDIVSGSIVVELPDEVPDLWRLAQQRR